MNITEDVVKLVARTLLGRLGPGGRDSGDLQGWILKYGEDRKRLLISVEMFVDWLANQNPPREA